MGTKNSKLSIKTPPSNAPEEWEGVIAEHWQSNGGRWAAPMHYMCSYMAMFPPELPHYFIERFTKTGDRVLDPFPAVEQLLLKQQHNPDLELAMI